MIGNRLVSTVGAFYPDWDREIESIAGPDAYYETMVFECDGEDNGGNPNILSCGELECERYKGSLAAEQGHRDACYRIAEWQEDV